MSFAGNGRGYTMICPRRRVRGDMDGRRVQRTQFPRIEGRSNIAQESARFRQAAQGKRSTRVGNGGSVHRHVQVARVPMWCSQFNDWQVGHFPVAGDASFEKQVRTGCQKRNENVSDIQAQRTIWIPEVVAYTMPKRSI